MPKFMLNWLKEMKGPISIYTPLGAWLKEPFKEAFMCASSKFFLRTFLTEGLTRNWLRVSWELIVISLGFKLD